MSAAGGTSAPSASSSSAFVAAPSSTAAASASSSLSASSSSASSSLSSSSGLASAVSASQQLVIPIALWNQSAPSHCVTSLLVTEDQTTLVTGAKSGQLCFWSLHLPSPSAANSEQAAKRAPTSLAPRFLAFTHVAAVNALVECIYYVDAAPTHVILSASADGVMAISDRSNGRCLQSAQCLPESPTQLEIIAQGTKVVCCGRFTDILIIDIATLSVTHVIHSVSKPGWISTLCVWDCFSSAGVPGQGLLTVSIDGTFQLWGLEFVTRTGVKPPDSPLSILSLEGCTRATAICVNPFNNSSILIVCNNEWILLPSNDFRPLCRMRCPLRLGWAGGSFFDAETILAWTHDGIGYLYRLPSLPDLPPLSLSSQSQFGFDKAPANAIPHQPTSNPLPPPLLREQSSGSFNPASYHLRLLGAAGQLPGQRAESQKAVLCNEEPALLCVFQKAMPPPEEQQPGWAADVPQTLLHGTYPVMQYQRRLAMDDTQPNSAAMFTIDMLVRADGLGQVHVWNVGNFLDAVSPSSSLAAATESGSTGLQSASPVHTQSPSAPSPISKRLSLISASNPAAAAAASSVLPRGSLQATGRKLSLSRTSSEWSSNILLPFINCSLAGVWEALGWQSNSHHGVDEAITATMMVDDTHVVRGFANGHIVISHIIGMCRSWTGLPPRADDHIVCRAHTDRITCLLYPEAVSDAPRQRTVFVSGSADFTVRVWSVTSGTLLKTFASHGGEIIRLIQPPRDSRAFMQSFVCSVAQDHSVCVYSLSDLRYRHQLGGHIFPITTVQWSVDDDYVVVGCTDGTVYVWQLSTNHLDRVATGQVALDILESCSMHSIPIHSSGSQHHPPSSSLPSSTPHLQLQPSHQQQLLQQQAQTHHSKHQPPQLPHLPPVDLNDLPDSTGSGQNSPRRSRGFPRLPLTKRGSQASSGSSSPVLGNSGSAGSLPGAASMLREGQTLEHQSVSYNVPHAHIHAPVAAMPLGAASIIPNTIPAVVIGSATPASSSPATTGSANNVPGTATAASASAETGQPLILQSPSRLRGKRAMDLFSLPVTEEEPRLPVLVVNVKRLIASLFQTFTTTSRFAEQDWWANLPTAIANVLLSHLIPWNCLPNLDATCTSKLGLHKPTHQLCLGVVGDDGRISLMLPDANNGSMRWQSSAHLSALCSMSVITLANTFMTLGSEVRRDGWSHLITVTCALLPDLLPNFVEPSLTLLARFWMDVQTDLQQAARTLVSQGLTRIGEKQRTILAARWDKVIESMRDPHHPVRVLHVLLLGVLGSEFSGLEMRIADNVARSLLRLLFDDSADLVARQRNQMIAAELLAVGFNLWSQTRIDVQTLLRRLLSLSAEVYLQTHASPAAAASNLSLSAHLRDSGNSSASPTKPQTAPGAKPKMHNSARHALLLIASTSPDAFVRALSNEVMGAANAGEEREHALRLIHLLVNKKAMVVVPYLARLVEIVVQCLDPSMPTVRQRCMAEATSILHDMVKSFRHIALHTASQRLAVGAPDGPIIVYDLRTASKWHALEGHAAVSTAIAFSPDGKYLASYSFDDRAVKVWQASTGFFGALSHSSTPSRTFPVARPVGMDVVSSEAFLDSVRLAWVQAPPGAGSKRKLELVRGGEEMSFVF
ncbi:hypothetical protein CAOG_03891 [Capsaspora owczarzaki ATCC 30864]|uniref:Uncharacterized protein n=1 Tax=Capsaspora owczarzaki (strain ATCC 30864) TaxID=595528 RepID=A0A0D2X2R7_CAPO3|nr:hypothetical protein CAOG_03891 [Capsaspora owczarzaki ATCC 30864]KJE93029.1 hypothetical protein CAOG_003891 [Capsaspora owczarzaki ATCC 30864]|eukprot:XP_004363619.1 hypothetical protein CAOG_03891 [Capsaspora owczarzaki ATCC 30864]